MMAATEPISTGSRIEAEVRRLRALVEKRDFARALADAGRLLQEVPENRDVLYLIAVSQRYLGRIDEALATLRRFEELHPDFGRLFQERGHCYRTAGHSARYGYAVVLGKRHKHATALEEARKLLKIDPRNRAFRTVYATACVGLGDHEEALRVYRELLTESPQNPELHLSVAHALKTQGRQAQAIEEYRAAAAARADFGDAYWSLANLKTYRFTDAELEGMRGLEAATTTGLVDRYHLCFALGKALEDRGEYEEAFRYYERGNAFKKSESRFDVGAMEHNLQLQARLCTREFLAARSGGGCERADPIFIVGLPRAGSTLLEQILASHSQVEGTMELADIPRMVQQLSGRENRDAPSRYPALLADLAPAERLRLGEKYIADTRVYLTDKPYFI